MRAMIRMKVTAIGMGVVVALSGCQVQTNATPLPTGASAVTQMSYNEFFASPAYQKVNAMKPVDSFAMMGVATHILQRCDKIVANRLAGNALRTNFNRAALLAGKAKISAAFDRAQAEFAAKYGKALQSDSNHCDAAARELREQSAISAFFLDNGL